MLGPFGQSASNGLSPQMIQQLIASMAQGGQSGGNMRAPMSNAAPQLPGGAGAAQSMAPMMPSIQGPQPPAVNDPLSQYLQMMQLRQLQQRTGPGEAAPGAQPGGVPPTAAAGPTMNGQPTSGVSTPSASNPLLMWLMKQIGMGGSSPAYTGLPGQ